MQKQGREPLLMSSTTLDCPFHTTESWRSPQKWVIKFPHITNLKELSVRLNLKRRYLPQQLLTISTTIPVLPQLRVPFTEQGFSYSSIQVLMPEAKSETFLTLIAQTKSAYLNSLLPTLTCSPGSSQRLNHQSRLSLIHL